LLAAGAAGVDPDLTQVEGIHGVEDEVDQMIGGHPVAQIGREQQQGVAVNRNEVASRVFQTPEPRRGSIRL
jgi:hypothetical protein